MADLEAALGRALDLGEEGDWEGMADHLSELLEDHDEEPTVLCWLGVAEHQMGLESSAYARFKACLSLDPTDPYILATAGVGLARVDDPDAETALRNAAIVGPEISQTRVAYGGYLSREGMSDEAFVHLDAALELAPEEAEVHGERGVALALAGRHDEAAESFHKAWEIDQEDGWNRGLAGMAELESGRFEEALGDLTAAMVLVPDDVELAIVTALTAMAIDHDEIAYQALEAARMWGEEASAAEIAAAADRLDEGAEASRRLLLQEVLPGVYRQRLMTRP